MKRAYIAAPFFNPAQLQIVESIKDILTVNHVPYFSPKDESMFKQGDDPKQILLKNVYAIKAAPYVIVVTDGKDVGTIFEAGYAFAKDVPILYVWFGYTPELKFNLMLGASGHVVHTYKQLELQIRSMRDFSHFIDTTDKGMLYE